MRIVTVRELNSYIKRRFDEDAALSGICVRGEISNFKHHYSGHMYMSLKDDSGSIRAVMFSRSASALKFEPKSGMNVLVFGRVGVYERDGQYQIYVDQMIPDGIGQLYAAYEQLKARLEAAGYFDAAHKKPIPRYPGTVGIVTSPTGAAVRDIINVISRRYPAADLKIYPALVQGVGAAESICRGIEFFNRNKLADVLIIGRGGGSIEDLWVFNEEKVAMAVYNSEIPVISAVGHETDFTISDFTADLRAPTPSAAAELAVPSAADLKSSLLSSRASLLSSLNELVRHKRAMYESLSSRRIFKNPMLVLEGKVRRLDEDISELGKAYSGRLEKYSSLLRELSYKLSALNPINVFGRGYSAAYTEGGIVKSINDVKSGEQLTLRVSDGEIDCTVENIRGDNNGSKKEL